MNKKFSSVLLPVIAGTLLVGLGTLLLLDNFNILQLAWSFVIGLAFASGGILFLTVFIANRKNWWGLISGLTLIGIGGVIILSELNSDLAEVWSGAIFLFAIGLSFWLIYINNTSNWWAIIPGGVLWVLAGVTLLPQDVFFLGSIFFIGLALTFLLVFILPKPEGRMKWALYPAGALLLVGLLAAIGSANWLEFIWPLALLVGGGLLIYFALRKKSKPEV